MTRKQYIWGGIVLVIIAAVVGFILWTMAGNKGTVILTPDRIEKPARSAQTLNGTYVTFVYRGVYSLKKLPATTSDFEMYDLTANTNYEKHLAVDVARLDGGSLASNVSYTSRAQHKELYSSSNITVDGGPAVLFVKNDTTERTVFATHGDKVVTLAFVSASTLDDLQGEIDALLSSFHWKQ